MRRSRGAKSPGPLAGVPVTVKVNIDQEGYATTNGLKLQRDVVAKANNPVVDNLRKAGAVILGRTNCPAFSYRWFTTNLIHGDTEIRVTRHHAGRIVGGAGAAVAAGIGHLANGTDIAGSIRYPAYACGVHGLRPTLGRMPACNASLPERADRTANVRGVGSDGALHRRHEARAGRHVAPRRARSLVGAGAAGRAGDAEGRRAVPPAGRPRARCRSRGGTRRGRPAAGASGMERGRGRTTPPLHEAAELQTKLWLGDGYEAQLAAANRESDPGALAGLAGNRAGLPFDAGALSEALTRRATLIRQWQQFLVEYAVVLMPVSGELPFPDQLDRQGRGLFARVWRAQMTQIAIPFMGLPGLTVSTGLVGRIPVGVQVVASRYREDLCLAAGEAIEAGGTPSAVIDPAG